MRPLGWGMILIVVGLVLFSLSVSMISNMHDACATTPGGMFRDQAGQCSEPSNGNALMLFVGALMVVAGILIGLFGEIFNAFRAAMVKKATTPAPQATGGYADTPRFNPMTGERIQPPSVAQTPKVQLFDPMTGERLR